MQRRIKSKSDFNDIGISRELDWPRIKKLLTIGLFASVLHLAGDLILGWGVEAVSYTHLTLPTIA